MDDLFKTEPAAPLAELLDRSHGSDEHARALATQAAKVDDPALTPSAQVLASMTAHQESFAAFALRQSQLHADYLRKEPLPAEEQARFDALARASLEEQSRLEQQEVGDFDLFVGAYQASILAISN